MQSEPNWGVILEYAWRECGKQQEDSRYSSQDLQWAPPNTSLENYKLLLFSDIYLYLKTICTKFSQSLITNFENWSYGRTGRTHSQHTRLQCRNSEWKLKIAEPTPMVTCESIYVIWTPHWAACEYIWTWSWMSSIHMAIHTKIKCLMCG
jgi:hypothetical protein